MMCWMVYGFYLELYVPAVLDMLLHLLMVSINIVFSFISVVYEFMLGNVLVLSLNTSLSLLEASIHSFKSHDWV